MKKIFLILLNITISSAALVAQSHNPQKIDTAISDEDLELIDAFAEDLAYTDYKKGYSVEENNKAWEAVISYILKPLSRIDFGNKVAPHSVLADFFVGAPTWYKPVNLPKWDYYAENEYLADFGEEQFYISLGAEEDSKYIENFLMVKGMDLVLQGAKLDFNVKERKDIQGASLAYDLNFKTGQKLIYSIYMVSNPTNENLIRLITIIHK